MCTLEERRKNKLKRQNENGKDSLNINTKVCYTVKKIKK